jgi:hypothetical protein
LTRVLSPFYLGGMWTTAENLQFSVVRGLRKGLGLIRGMRHALTEVEQDKVGAAIAEQLESSNWRIEQGPERNSGHTEIMGQ